jgi:hypothetical protein
MLGCLIGRSRLAGWAAVAAVGGAVLASGTAWAISIGPYSWKDQGCPRNADAETTQRAYPGCHNIQVLVRDGRGHIYLEAGVLQSNQRQYAHAGTVAVSPNGSATPAGGFSGPGVGATFDTRYQPVPPNQCDFEDTALYGLEYASYLIGQSSKPCTLDPTKWRLPSQTPTVNPTVRLGIPNPNALELLTGFQIYLFGDNNVNKGQHDAVNGQYGTAGASNGPSDGGGFVVNWHPMETFSWLATLAAVLQTHSLAPIAENPVPLLDAGAGVCADGPCVAVETRRRTMYQGGGGNGGSRDVYNYHGKKWGPYDCSSDAVQNERACETEGHHPMTWYRQQETKNVYAEPGIQIFEDPDPQGSPILPAVFYPFPAVYVGTCGAVVGGGSFPAPPSPMTNSSGQLVVDPTGC